LDSKYLYMKAEERRLRRLPLNHQIHNSEILPDAIISFRHRRRLKRAAREIARFKTLLLKEITGSSESDDDSGSQTNIVLDVGVPVRHFCAQPVCLKNTHQQTMPD
jgi:hypothetical protein